tara:strand:- start:10253 stop:10585 length:333 start_codon:yes stop_codon:yes gene_type:complete
MPNIGYYREGTFIEEGVSPMAATGSETKVYTGNTANFAVARFLKHVSQAGGATPIAYYTINTSNPSVSNGVPIYDGDVLNVYPYQIRTLRLASSDVNQPTIHYQLYNVGG